MFSPGEIVWAKYDTYPYWPARIAPHSITEKLKEYYQKDGIGVLFFGSILSYGLVDEKCVLPFEENYNEFSLCIEPDFSVALQMAKKNDVGEPDLELPKRKKRKSVKKEDDGVYLRNVGEKRRKEGVQKMENKEGKSELGSDNKMGVEESKNKKEKKEIKKNEENNKKDINKDNNEEKNVEELINKNDIHEDNKEINTKEDNSKNDINEDNKMNKEGDNNNENNNKEEDNKFNKKNNEINNKKDNEMNKEEDISKINVKEDTNKINVKEDKADNKNFDADINKELSNEILPPGLDYDKKENVGEDFNKKEE